MTLEEIYYIGQTVAVFAIVASLVFVGVQIQMQRAESQIAAMRDVHKEWRDLLRYLIENREISELVWFKAQPEGFDALTPQEALRVIQHGDIFMNYWQEAYRLHKSNRLDAAHFHAVEKKLSEGLRKKGGQEILQVLLPDLTEDFRSYLLDVVARLQAQHADEYDLARDKIVFGAGVRNAPRSHRRKSGGPQVSDGVGVENDGGSDA